MGGDGTFQKFKSGMVFRVQELEFDGKMKPEYMSTPIERAMLLTKPSKLQEVPSPDQQTLKDVALHPSTPTPCHLSEGL